MKELTDTEITINSMSDFLKNKFSVLSPDLLYEGYGDYDSNKKDLIYEVRNYGLKKISDLDRIIPTDYLDKIKESKLKLNYLGTVRVLMIINDWEKYVRNYVDFGYINSWRISNLKSLENFLSSYNVSVDEMIKKANS